MLKIYDSKEQVPEALIDHYTKRADGKYEPHVEGINSIGGLLAKRDELLDKVRKIPALESRVAELETLETLPAGKVAVDKKDYEAIKAEHDAYAAFGKPDEIAPKLAGYDELKTKEETRARQDSLRAVAKAEGYDAEKFLVLVGDKPLDTVIKTVNENGKVVEKYYVKTKDQTGKEVETPVADYVRTAPNFAPFADSLTAGTNSNNSGGTGYGTKVIKQSPQGGSATPTIETEKEAVRATGVYGL